MLCVSAFDQGGVKHWLPFSNPSGLSSALRSLASGPLQDLKETPQDYESIGMKKLQMNRMLAALQ